MDNASSGGSPQCLASALPTIKLLKPNFACCCLALYISVLLSSKSSNDSIVVVARATSPKLASRALVATTDNRGSANSCPIICAKAPE